MRELRQKQKIKKVIYSLPALIMLALLSIFLMKGAVGVMSKQSESEKYVQELEKEAKALAVRGKELEDKIKRLDTDEGKIEEIKEKFNVSLEGEKVAILVENRDRESTTTESTSSWYGDLWNGIKDLFRR